MQQPEQNTPTAAFLNYAEAFEVGFASRDWTHVDRVMTDDVIWSVADTEAPVGGTHVGRAPSLDAIRVSTDNFDRRFDRREPRVVEGPREIPGGIHMTWEVTYSREGLAPFVLVGEEWDFFRDGKLELHRERIHNMEAALAFVAENNAALVPVRG